MAQNALVQHGSSCPNCFWGTIEQTGNILFCECGMQWHPDSPYKAIDYVLKLLKEEMCTGTTPDCGPSGENLLRKIYNSLSIHRKN